MSFTIGSLFDGSGGFPLSAFLCGGVPVWASEVEPYPIAVTKTRFPYMKHLGSVTDVKGNEVEPVDVISFGSPCQDLSVAGKRAGLKHEDNGDDETTRSGLFMEAVRIIKEMREATNGRYPTFALWENVPGAFSSNKGEDFRTVLEELVKIVEPSAVMPKVPKNGWSYSDCYMGDGWSLAYRTFDAQYWGVPQRRRRIYLVLDLRGERADKVLFEREGLRGYFAEGSSPWQTVTSDAERGIGSSDRERNCVIAIDQQGGKGGANYAVDVMPTICSDSHGTPHAVAYTPKTLKIRSGCEGGGKGALIQDDLSATLSTLNDQYLFQPVDCLPFDSSQITCPTNGSNPHWGDPCHAITATGYVPTVIIDGTIALEGNGSRPSHHGDGYIESDKMYTLNTIEQHAVCYGICSDASNSMKSDNPHSGIYEAKTARTIDQNGANPSCNQGGIAIVEPVVFDARGNGDGRTVSTITGDHENRITDYTSVVVESENPTTAVYSMKSIARNGVPLVEQTNPICACDYKDPDIVAYGVDCRNATEYPDVNGTLQAKSNGGFSYNCNQVVRTQYIVRRLTPTECARLQGFADGWGIPDKKDDFTEEEYQFWLKVRNTHAEINGKAVKDYTKKQMLTWYNKLHTDSSEYKLWGNGIALPCALYVMQGISDILN